MKKLLFIIVSFLVFTGSGFSQDCKCYYGSECSSKVCDYRSGCTHTDTGNPKDPKGKKFDGTCKSENDHVYGTPEFSRISKLVENIFLAFEKVGREEGGRPDVNLMIAAQKSIDDIELYNTMRQLVVGFFIPITIGLTDYANQPSTSGYFNPPTDPSDLNDNGVIEPLTNEILTVMALVRQAIVTEINSPGNDNFDRFMNRIPILVPSYQTLGRCEFPHPIEHNHDFPFDSGFECLKSELYDGVLYITSVPCNNNLNSTFVCHKGRTVCISIEEKRKHIAHQDIEVPCSDFSQQRIYTTHSSVFSTHQDINIFPNPVSSDLSVEFYLAEDFQGIFHLYDIYGKVVFQSEKYSGEGRFYRFTVDTKDLSKGIYILKSNINGEVYMNKVQVIKE